MGTWRASTCRNGSACSTTCGAASRCPPPRGKRSLPALEDSPRAGSSEPHLAPGAAHRAASLSAAVLALFWRYHLRPELRDLRRSIAPRTLATLVPLALLLWLVYAGYFLAVYGGQIALPLPGLRWSMLGSFAVAFVLRTRRPRSAVMFHATTPADLATSLRLQALANSVAPLAYAVLYLAGAVPAALHASPAPLAAVRYLAADASMLALIVSHLSVSPVLAGLRPRARLAWAGAVLAFLGVEVAACLRWDAANLVVLTVNLAVLAASWCNRPPLLESGDPVRRRGAAPGPLAAQGADRYAHPPPADRGRGLCPGVPAHPRRAAHLRGRVWLRVRGSGRSLGLRHAGLRSAREPHPRVLGDRRGQRGVSNRPARPSHHLLQTDAGLLCAFDPVPGAAASGRAGADYRGSAGPGAGGRRRAGDAGTAAWSR